MEKEVKDRNSLKPPAPRRWIWLRGLARQSQHWYDFESHFRHYFPDPTQDQIEMLDARGNGTERHLPSFLSINDFVRDLRARSQLAKQGPVHLLTMSLGSMIGIDWATRYPQEVASLTIINTSDGRTSHPFQRLSLSNYRSMLDTFTHGHDPYRVEMNIMNMIARNVRNKEAVVTAFAKMARPSPQNLFRQLFAGMRFRLPQTKPTTPLLILAGKKDLFVNPACSTNIGKAWNEPVIYHEEAGHDLPLEFPEWVAEQVADFIKKSTSQN